MGSRRFRRCRRREGPGQAACARRSAARPCLRLKASGLAKKSKSMVFGFSAYAGGEVAQVRDGFAKTGIEGGEPRLAAENRGITGARRLRAGRVRRAPWVSSRSGAGCGGPETWIMDARIAERFRRRGRQCRSRRTQPESWQDAGDVEREHCRCR
jgi:hypothetical protein